MIVGTFKTLPIGYIMHGINDFEGNAQPHARAQVLRQATYAEWVACLQAQGVDPSELPEAARNGNFYEVSLD